MKLHATAGFATLDSSLNIEVLPRATTVSTIAGPTTGTERTTATYAYSETHSPVGSVSYTPSCGSLATLVESIDGSRFTCRFNDISQPSTADVSIAVSAAGGSDTKSIAVTVNPDTVPPDLTLPETIQVNSASNAGSNVTFTTSAVDAVSGSAPVALAH